MKPKIQKFPFEAVTEEILKDIDSYIDSVFSCLESEFLVMPKGAGFVEYPVFERGYEVLKAVTNGFSRLDPEKIFPVTVSEPISLVFCGPCWELLRLNGDMLQLREQVFPSHRVL